MSGMSDKCEISESVMYNSTEVCTQGSALLHQVSVIVKKDSESYEARFRHGNIGLKW